MSLRREMHSAFDEIAPTTAGLPERVVQTVVRQRHGHQRRERWVLRIRAPLSLVAAVVLIALVAAVLVSGRLVQDWNAWHNGVPAGERPQTDIAQLEARPLMLPTLQPNDSCPDGPEANGLWGSGPVLAAPGWTQPKTANELAGNFSTQWGEYWYQTYIVGDQVSGPILARGKDLRTNQRMIFVGNYAAGSVVGSDSINGRLVQQHQELILDMSRPPAKPTTAHKLEWPVITGLAKGSSDCVAWQLDGPDFTEVWVVYVLPDP